jgi:hypothetical protein
MRRQPPAKSVEFLQWLQTAKERGGRMWAQLMKFRVAEGKEDQMQRLDGQWTEEIGRGTDSGWVRSITLRSDKDPQEWYELVFFESEAKARANEKTPKHEALVKQMMDVAEGIDFVDLTPVNESSR